MNPEVGSIMNYFYSIFPVKIYDKEVTTSFVRPSLYFPAPISFNSNDTNTTFLKTYTLSVKLFHDDSQKAYAEAERIANTVNARRHMIPLLDEDGTDTGKWLRISRVEVRVGDMGVATLSIQWDSRYHYERENKLSLNDVDIKSGVK